MTKLVLAKALSIEAREQPWRPNSMAARVADSGEMP